MSSRSSRRAPSAPIRRSSAAAAAPPASRAGQARRKANSRSASSSSRWLIFRINVRSSTDVSRITSMIWAAGIPDVRARYMASASVDPVTPNRSSTYLFSTAGSAMTCSIAPRSSEIARTGRSAGWTAVRRHQKWWVSRRSRARTLAASGAAAKPASTGASRSSSDQARSSQMVPCESCCGEPARTSWPRNWVTIAGCASRTDGSPKTRRRPSS